MNDRGDGIDGGWLINNRVRVMGGGGGYYLIAFFVFFVCFFLLVSHVLSLFK